MNSCCRLGNEYYLKSNVLYESDNFFVVPTIGSMKINGYLLICSKKHFISIGNTPEEYEAEINDILNLTRKILIEKYNQRIIVFEHGPKLKCNKGGGCIDHAHLHLIPTPVDIVNFLNKKFNLEEINNFNKIREIYNKQEKSYIYIENHDLKKYVIELEFSIPSQYLRQIIASELKINNWDWRINPDHETFKETIEDLKGKF